MSFEHNYFNVKMNSKKVKINTDVTEFTVTVKNGKATFNVGAESVVTDECNDYCDCSDYCDGCTGCDEIKEVVVEDNKPDTINVNIEKTLDRVC